MLWVAVNRDCAAGSFGISGTIGYGHLSPLTGHQPHQDRIPFPKVCSCELPLCDLAGWTFAVRTWFPCRYHDTAANNGARCLSLVLRIWTLDILASICSLFIIISALCFVTRRLCRVASQQKKKSVCNSLISSLAKSQHCMSCSVLSAPTSTCPLFFLPLVKPRSGGAKNMVLAKNAKPGRCLVHPTTNAEKPVLVTNGWGTVRYCTYMHNFTWVVPGW